MSKAHPEGQEVGGQVGLEPGVLPDVLDFDSLELVFVQHAPDEVTRLGVDVRCGGERERTAADLLEESGNVLVVKGQRATEHGEQNHPAGPHVYLWAPIQPPCMLCRIVVFVNMLYIQPRRH